MKLSALIQLVAPILPAVCLTACDVHQFPEDDVATFGDEQQIRVVLTYPEGEMPVYTEETYSRASTLQTDYDVRYTACFYPRKSGNTYASTPDTTVTFTRRNFDMPDVYFGITLPAGDYRVVAWTDFVNRNSTLDKYYDLSSFPEVYLNTALDHEANNDFRDCYRGKETFNIVANLDDQEVFVEMRRPVGKYILIATDIDQLESLGSAKAAAAVRAGNYTTLVSYSGFMPNAYHLVNDFNSDATGGVKFNTTASIYNDATNEVYLGGDYVFTNSDGGSVSAILVVYNADGEAVAQTDAFSIPMMQGKLTIVRGTFFSASGGGVGLDPEFVEPDYNVPIN